MNILLMMLIALVIYVTFDTVWVGVIATNFYKSKLGHVISSKIKLIPALIFYVVFIYGLVFFVIEPAISEDVIIGRLISLSATYGLVTYGAFNLLSKSTIKDWPTVITFLNILGGVIMSIIVSVGTYWIYGLIIG